MQCSVLHRAIIISINNNSHVVSTQFDLLSTRQRLFVVVLISILSLRLPFKVASIGTICWAHVNQVLQLLYVWNKKKCWILCLNFLNAPVVVSFFIYCRRIFIFFVQNFNIQFTIHAFSRPFCRCYSILHDTSTAAIVCTLVKVFTDVQMYCSLRQTKSG